MQDRDRPERDRPDSQEDAQDTFQESGQHGPLLDDELSRETRGMIRGTGSTHAEEWKDPEPAGTIPKHGREPGSPPGMSPDDVDARSEVAKALAPVRFPAGVGEILRRFDRAGVPDEVTAAARRLPQGATYDGVIDVVHALGIHTEEYTSPRRRRT